MTLIRNFMQNLKYWWHRWLELRRKNVGYSNYFTVIAGKVSKCPYLKKQSSFVTPKLAHDFVSVMCNFLPNLGSSAFRWREIRWNNVKSRNVPLSSLFRQNVKCPYFKNQWVSWLQTLHTSAPHKSKVVCQIWGLLDDVNGSYFNIP